MPVIDFRRAQEQRARDLIEVVVTPSEGVKSGPHDD